LPDPSTLSLWGPKQTTPPPVYEPSTFTPSTEVTVPPAPLLSMDMPSPEELATQAVEARRQTNFIDRANADMAKQQSLSDRLLAKGSGGTSGGNNTIIANAQRYEGIPYKWGGKSAKTGFDCSGFTQAVARDSGVSIPGSTATQLAWFKSKKLLVGSNNLQVGDYIYFSSGGPTGRHVGIYMGGGKMIDAPHTGSVVGVHSIAGRTIIGVGRLPQKGDAYSTRAAHPVKPGPAPFGLDEKLWEALTRANNAMDAAGVANITVTEGFRPASEQKQLLASQPGFAAPVGKSKHGDGGKAADINVTNPAGWKWLHANASRFGLAFPSKDEAWHAELDPRRGSK
jgi:cell wall-associated NlpC family hydrolase